MSEYNDYKDQLFSHGGAWTQTPPEQYPIPSNSHQSSSNETLPRGASAPFYAPSLMLGDESPRPSMRRRTDSIGSIATNTSRAFSSTSRWTASSVSTIYSRTGPQPAQQVPAPRLVCEFFQWNRCSMTFDIDDEDSWIVHVLNDHLHGDPPASFGCCFCDEFHTSSRNRDIYPSFQDRMEHVADHFWQGLTGRNMRIDRRLQSHLSKREIEQSMMTHPSSGSSSVLHPQGWRPLRYDPVYVEIAARRRRNTGSTASRHTQTSYRR